MHKLSLSLFKGGKLRNRLIVLFAVLVTVPLLALGFTALFLVETSHKHDVAQMHALLLNQKTEEIDKFFADTLDVLNIRIPEVAVSEAGVGQLTREQQEFFLEGFLSTNRAFQSVSFIDPFELRIASTLERGRTPEFSIRYLTSTEIESDRFQKTAVGGEKFIGEVYYQNETTMISLGAPIKDGEGNIIYLLYAETSLSQIATSIKRSGLGALGYLVLTDTSGRIIAQGSSDTLPVGQDISEYERVQKVLAGQIMDGRDDEDRYKSFFGDVAVVGAGRSVPATAWALISEWPISEADAFLTRMRGILIQLIIFGILAVFVLASIFATRIVRPIKKLQHAAREIEQGKLDTQVSIKTNDELEELATTFNKMTSGLKRLQELKDEFVFVAAHELRSPVTVIKGYISMLLEGSAGRVQPQAEDFLKKTQVANDRLNQLVEDLLEIARSEAGRLEIKVSPIDISLPIKEVADELKPLADEKQIGLLYTVPTQPIFAVANADRIKEIMVNLAGNAIKYTPNGGKVEIFHAIQDNMVITHVRDNGLGISKEAQVKLFTKFYRVQTEKTKDITGTGLGLFIVKQIVEKMGGRIWMVSEEGNGSVFSFSLPLDRLRRGYGGQAEKI